MTVEVGPPSRLRRLIFALARVGVDIRPSVHRARNFVLRPIRREMAAALATESEARLSGDRDAEIAWRVVQDEGCVARDAERAAWRAEMAELQRQIAALRQHQDDAAAGLAQVTAQVVGQQAVLADLARRIEDTGAQARQDLDRHKTTALAEVDRRFEAERSERRERIGLLEHLVSAGPNPARSEAAGETALPAVSIILPTQDRAGCLPDAIESVMAQRLTEWELIIVDDGSTDDTEAVVGPFLTDRRIRFVRQSRQGQSAARNHALRLARGAVIAYLDSDNLLYPDFLQEATRTLRDDPTVDVVYGVLVTDAHDLEERCLLFSPFDREKLLRGNFIDQNTVVHRRRLVEEHGSFDETIRRLEDWDLLLRYTAAKPALALPVLAARYSVRDAQRITDRVPEGPYWLAIQEKWYPPQSTRRWPRVLYGIGECGPATAEAIETELRCMRRWGALVEVWRQGHDGGMIEDAMRRMAPDAIHGHGLDWAVAHAATLAAIGLPVTLRLGGADKPAETVQRLTDMPWLRAVYVDPARMALFNEAEPRLKPAAVGFDSTMIRPHAAKNRRLVMCALPQDDMAFAAMLAERLPMYRVVVCGAETDAPADLMTEAAFCVHHDSRDDPRGLSACAMQAMATGASTISTETADLAAERILAAEAWSEEAWHRAWMQAVDTAFMKHADSIVLRPLFDDWCQLVADGH